MNNLGTVAVSVFLVVIVSCVIFTMVKNRKNGKTSCGCGCGCSHCKNHCGLS